ncbi:MAG: conjugative transposon protein TraM [Alistipes sp.]|nr:conjugative transposon protein TraM [Candidatus Alistipes equi]
MKRKTEYMLYALSVVVVAIPFMLSIKKEQTDGFNCEFPKAYDGEKCQKPSGALLMEVPLLTDSVFEKSALQTKNSTTLLDTISKKKTSINCSLHKSQTALEAVGKARSVARDCHKEKRIPKKTIKDTISSGKYQKTDQMELIRESYRLAMELSGKTQKKETPGITHKKSYRLEKLKENEGVVSSLCGMESEAKFFGCNNETQAPQGEELFLFKLWQKQTIENGSSMLLSLNEDVLIEGHRIYSGTIFEAVAKVDKDHLFIEVNFLEIDSKRIPLCLKAVSAQGSDGFTIQEGELRTIGNAIKQGTLEASNLGLSHGILQRGIHEGVEATREILEKKIQKKRIVLESGMTLFMRNAQ